MRATPVLPRNESLTARRIRRHVSGVLLLDKPAHVSSNHALQAAKRIFQADKAGHAGTLDPLASGLLPVLFGGATRFSGYLLEADKRYEAEVRLGITTRTGDAEGEVLEQRPVRLDETTLAQVLEKFRGAQWQTPPMYSALKRDGTPLYVLARRGETVERQARQIHISGLTCTIISGERLKLDVTCSKGTYIRTLAEDIGAALGCGAHLSALRRTGSGAFSISQATALDTLTRLDPDRRDALLLAADSVLVHLPRVELDAAMTQKFCYGQSLGLAGAPPGICRVYGPGGRFLGLAQTGDDGLLVPKRLLEQVQAGSPSG